MGSSIILTRKYIKKQFRPFSGNKVITFYLCLPRSNTEPVLAVIVTKIKKENQYVKEL